MISPLLKWPGGKTRELPLLAPLIDKQWENFVEPFVGGGACFFSLAPQKAVINDVNEALVGLYQQVQKDSIPLRRKLENLAKFWDVELAELVMATREKLVAAFQDNRGELKDKRVRENVVAPIKRTLRDFCIKQTQDWLPASSLFERLRQSSLDKIRRVKGLEEKHSIQFTEEKLGEHFETAIRAGVYTCLRDDIDSKRKDVRLTRFFFLREYCYGSMFRFNRAGKFNIPYGGIAYNKKALTRKVAALFDKERRSLLARAEITNEDFRTFFNKRSSDWGPETLVFLDPPYDSEFSEYDRYPFNGKAQAELAKIVSRLNASYVVVIKDTPLIRNLYEKEQQNVAEGLRPMVIENYQKRYTYNVRGRNKRDVTHLLIHNMGSMVKSA